MSFLVGLAGSQKITTCTEAGQKLGMNLQAAARCRDRLQEHVYIYNERHPQAQVPPIHLLVVRKDTDAPALTVAGDVGMPRNTFKHRSSEERRERAHPYHECIFKHQDWKPFQDYVNSLRAVALVAVLLGGLLLWPASLLANPFSHGYRTTPAWARDGETLCRTYNSLFQRCVVQSCDQLPVSSGRELAQRMAREIRPGNSPTASAERDWLVAEITGNCPQVQ